MTKRDNVILMPDIGSIGSEASQWLVLLEDGDVSSETRMAFLEWYNQSEKHKAAFDERASLWSGYDNITLLKDIAESKANKKLVREDARSATYGVMRRRSALTGLAASLVLAMGAALFVAKPDLFPIDRNIYETAIGEQKTIELPDGSSINLNTGSKVIIAFTAEARNVELLEGEAYFDVEHNPDRPFSVFAGGKSVMAVGTAFTVRRLDENVAVTVAKGRVALFSDQSSPNDSPLEPSQPIAQIDAGTNVVFNRNIESMETIGPDKLALRLAWRGGVLAFRDEPLSAVVSEMGRYTGMSVDIVSPEYADMAISGYVKIGATDDMFEALHLMTDLKVERIGRNHVLLTPEG